MFKRNKETGIVEIWKNGEKVGEIETLGDKVKKTDKDNDMDNLKSKRDDA